MLGLSLSGIGLTEVYISIGSNLDREHNIRRALRYLHASYTDLKLSKVYESEAIGFNGPPFLNLVACLNTTDSIPQALHALHNIEALCGRQRNRTLGSRSLDLDLLLFGQCVVDNGHRKIPHPDILRYPFVLQPLVELASNVIHPHEGRTIGALWRTFQLSCKSLLKPYSMLLSPSNGETDSVNPNNDQPL